MPNKNEKCLPCNRQESWEGGSEPATFIWPTATNSLFHHKCYLIFRDEYVFFDLNRNPLLSKNQAPAVPGQPP